MSNFNKQKDWFFPVVIGLIVGFLFVAQRLWFNTTPKVTSTSAGSYADIIEPVLPFTVSIFTNRKASTSSNDLSKDPYFSKYFNKDSQNQTSLGSGIILNQNGIVVTNAHVVRGAENIIITTHQGESASVTGILIDPESDIAVLETNLKLSADLPFNTDQADRVGDLVFTIGNPFGIGQSVSMGVISATGRQQPGLTTLTDFIQTDAAINPGNSGGALINAQGEVIGMNTAIFSSTGGSQGIGFAIPFVHVKSVADELSQNGLVTRGYLGIDVAELTPTEKENLSLTKSGLKIISVKSDSPAEKAGILPGDILLAINSLELSSRTEAARLITQLMPGKETTIQLLRNGKTLALSAILSQRN